MNPRAFLGSCTGKSSEFTASYQCYLALTARHIADADKMANKRNPMYPPLRFIIRDGKRILQFAYQYSGGEGETDWEDVPLVDEDASAV